MGVNNPNRTFANVKPKRKIDYDASVAVDGATNRRKVDTEITKGMPGGSSSPQDLNQTVRTDGNHQLPVKRPYQKNNWQGDGMLPKYTGGKTKK